MNQKIRVVHKLNGGLSSSRNARADLASDEYIAFGDTGDYKFMDV